MGLENLSDEELIGIVKRKDEHFNSALGRLYTKYYNAICGFSKSILGSKEDAEDNVNDVFYKIFLDNKDISNYKGKGSFKSWILGIAHNIAINKLDRRKLQNKFLDGMVKEFHLSEDSGFYSKENREILRKELKEIGGIHSEIIYLREFFDMDYDEISDFLNMSSSTCRSRNKRALDELRTSLTEKYGEEQFLS